MSRLAVRAMFPAVLVIAWFTKMSCPLCKAMSPPVVAAGPSSVMSTELLMKSVPACEAPSSPVETAALMSTEFPASVTWPKLDVTVPSIVRAPEPLASSRTCPPPSAETPAGETPAAMVRSPLSATTLMGPLLVVVRSSRVESKIVVTLEPEATCWTLISPVGCTVSASASRM